jgi:hypothetical protein
VVKPAFIFGGRNTLDHRWLHELGFNVYAVGKSPLTHFGTRDSGLAVQEDSSTPRFRRRGAEDAERP